jgi:hypothetical protein
MLKKIWKTTLRRYLSQRTWQKLVNLLLKNSTLKSEIIRSIRFWLLPAVFSQKRMQTVENSSSSVFRILTIWSIPIKTPTFVFFKYGTFGLLIFTTIFFQYYPTVCILFCENTAVKSPKRMDLIISLLSVEFFNNKLTSFCQVLCDKYLPRVVFQIFF